MGWVDIALLAWLAVSVLVGLVRGMVFELLALLGWVAAYAGAVVFGPQLAAHLPIGSAGSALNRAAAFACAFIGVLVLWGLCARLVRMLVHATPLSALDRLLGGVFGLARGVLVGFVIAWAVSATPWQKSAAWQESQGAAWLGGALRHLKPLLPALLAGHLPR